MTKEKCVRLLLDSIWNRCVVVVREENELDLYSWQHFQGKLFYHQISNEDDIEISHFPEKEALAMILSNKWLN